MTRLLQQGIEAVRGLPTERQNMAGEVLLGLANDRAKRYTLTAEQVKDVKSAVAEADRGEFVGEEEMAATWKGFGL
jgi:hypothetical protein